MTALQLKIMWTGIALATLDCLFPPVVGSPMSLITLNRAVDIDTTRLMIQQFMIVLVSVGAIVTARSNAAQR